MIKISERDRLLEQEHHRQVRVSSQSEPVRDQVDRCRAHQNRFKSALP